MQKKFLTRRGNNFISMLQPYQINKELIEKIYSTLTSDSYTYYKKPENVSSKLKALMTNIS